MMNSVYDDLVPEPQPDVPEPPTKEENPVKSIFKSWTVWANLAGGIAALAAAVAKSDVVANNPEYAAYAATAMAVINLVLRVFKTKEPIKVIG
jgi:hypothetical protein